MATPVPDPNERRRTALRTSVADMIRSMAVILAIVVLLVLLVPRTNSIERPRIDVASAASAAVERLDFEPVVPGALPEGWVPTRASVLDGTDGIATWAIVYRTPDGGFAGVKQASGTTAKWESTQVVQAQESGSREVAGQRWLVRDRADRDTDNLVLRGVSVTTVVTTQGTDVDVATLAAVLDLSPEALPAG